MALQSVVEKNQEMLKDIWLPAYAADLINLETMMGSIETEDNEFSYKSAVARDEAEAFPVKACKALDEWGLLKFYVPIELGGALYTYESIFGLLRLISRRDLTIAIGHGKTYLGASPVWTAGNEAQKKIFADLVLRGGIVALGLTEKSHGSDLIANEVSANKIEDGYIINGEKWLINNASRSDAITVFAKTDASKASRGYSIIALDKKTLNKDSYYHLPKIKTHGIRGADISGIGFKNAKVGQDALIARDGSGLEVTLKSLQISRTICANLSLGAADTALRTTLKFSLARHLYGISIIEIPYVRNILVNAFIDIIIAEVIAIFTVRCLHFCPSLMSLYSSITKFLVPMKMDKVFDELAGILGARFYLRETHDHGIFQKFLRDNSLVGLFDGSTIVNLQNIANQINSVIKKAKTNLQQQDLCDAYKNIFTLAKPVPMFEPALLSISAHGRDFMPYVFEHLISEITHSTRYSENYKESIISLLNILIDEREQLFAEIAKKSYFYEKINKEKALNLQRYCLIVAAACCASALHYNSCLANNYVSTEMLLNACLTRIISELQDKKRSYLAADNEGIWNYVKQLAKENRLFSLMPMNLG